MHFASWWANFLLWIQIHFKNKNKKLNKNLIYMFNLTYHSSLLHFIIVFFSFFFLMSSLLFSFFFNQNHKTRALIKHPILFRFTSNGWCSPLYHHVKMNKIENEIKFKRTWKLPKKKLNKFFFGKKKIKNK